MKKMNFKEVGIPTIILFSICIIVALALALTNSLTSGIIAENALQSEIEARQSVLAGEEYELVSEENGVSVYAVLVNGIPGSEPNLPIVSPADISISDLSATDILSGVLLRRPWTGVKTEVTATDISNTDISGTDVTNTDISATDTPKTDKYLIGYVATSASKGYGGDVQIMIGIDLNLKITGIEILEQSETAGLGANCENPEWLSQFVGKSGTLAVSKDGGEIDAITASTITSRAVTSAVNKALAQVSEIERRQAQ